MKPIFIILRIIKCWIQDPFSSQRKYFLDAHAVYVEFLFIEIKKLHHIIIIQCISITHNERHASYTHILKNSFSDCERCGIMGLISIYLLRFFQNVTFLAAWLSDMPLTKTENTERGFKRNFLKSDLSDWFVKTEKSSSHTFWYWSRLQHLLNYNSDKKHHLSLICKYFINPYYL